MEIMDGITMEITVEAPRLESSKTASHSGGGEEAGCKVAGAENSGGVRSYKAVGRKIAERSVASRLPKLPDDGWKVIIRPKGGLAVIKNTSQPILGVAVRRAASLEWKKTKSDLLFVNDKQGTILFHTWNFECAGEVMSIKTIKIEDKDHEVTAYMVAPENCGKGVVHGMDIRMTEETIMDGFDGHEQNPEILGIRRMGRSTTVVITFAEAEVPRTLVCFGMIMKCFLFKKRYEVCYRQIQEHAEGPLGIVPQAYTVDARRSFFSSRATVQELTEECATELTVRMIAKGSPLLVVGDFNADHPAWGYRFAQVKGKDLWNSIQQNGLTLLTDPLRPTRQGNSVSQDTTPDLTLVGGRISATESQSGQDGIEYIDEWSRGVIQLVQDATEEIEVDENQERVDRHMINLWRKKHELNLRLEQERGDRNLRRQLAALNKEIEEYALTLTKQNWSSIYPDKSKLEARQQLQKLVYKYEGTTDELIAEVRDRYLSCVGSGSLPEYSGLGNPDLDSPITDFRRSCTHISRRTAPGGAGFANLDTGSSGFAREREGARAGPRSHFPGFQRCLDNTPKRGTPTDR
ncbi:hypothetical protein HPB49_021493 [Dermacentor silvarum]|uniref:Uncharacterized protein n=1 Tax=Dermacentor silvarum TaxID=543639 RepID=A0ACB8CBA6_DERSI|nr:hypothetical protein HPB49_021493 [Dermacentor silvarum]